jgi:hypothetical protein
MQHPSTASRRPTGTPSRSAKGARSTRSTRSTRSAGSARLRRAAGLAAAALVVAAMLLGSSPPAPARADEGDPSASLQVSPLRRPMPIKAGTILAVAGGTCTAGAVLYRTELTQRLSPYLRATRYVVTAKHCGEVGTSAFVGDQLAGAVTYTSPTLDFSVITVPPTTESARHCSVSVSGVPACYPLTSYTPRALGRVFVGGNGLTFSAPVPVAGARDPAPGEDFCTSGSVSGWSCGWDLVRPYDTAVDYDRQAENDHFGIRSGDSGGPVVDRAGHLLGIMSAGADPLPQRPGVLAYVSMTAVLRELSSFRVAQD